MLIKSQQLFLKTEALVFPRVDVMVRLAES